MSQQGVNILFLRIDTYLHIYVRRTANIFRYIFLKGVAFYTLKSVFNLKKKEIRYAPKSSVLTHLPEQK